MKWSSLACVAWFFALPMMLHGDEQPIPELAPLQAQYQAKVAREVFQPHQTDVANLLANYRAAVSHGLEAAQSSNKVEEIVALKAEQASVESGQSPPPTDDAATPKALKSLRNTFRLEMVHLDRARDQKWQPLRDEYARSLGPLVENLARQSKFEEALAVKELVDRMKSLGLAIVGKWNIQHCGDVKAVWTFNKNSTYNYWNETGKYTFKEGAFHLKHTWDWDIRMVDDDTFEGVCTRGKVGCVIHATRMK